MNILLLTAHFRPNVGGVETHLDDLCKVLVKKGFNVFVLTYRPLQTKVIWKILEKKNSIEIIRIPWIPNLFYKLIENPFLEFIYLFPGLFLITPFILFLKKPEVIHAQGLVAGFVAVFWGKIFNKRVIISIHNIYHFPKKGLYTKFVRGIFRNTDLIMGLSNQAENEIKSLGVQPQKVKKFTYWIDLDKFKTRSSKFKVKQSLGWGNKFIVLFVGRLVEEKGIRELLDAALIWDEAIKLVIIGSGPLEKTVGRQITKSNNIVYLGKIEQDKLPLYYNGADLLIVPSTSEEGFGRVILESLACGTPVIGARRGAIPEAMDETVGKFMEVSPTKIKDEVEYLFNHPGNLRNLARNSRKFAERRYSEKNAETIIKAYRI